MKVMSVESSLLGNPWRVLEAHVAGTNPTGKIYFDMDIRYFAEIGNRLWGLNHPLQVTLVK